ncbi:MAG: HPr family phosphocarrier protein [Lachnospiraceae bacterium]|nr:HPr family phosphocarrier protein [Lachnospiraceae bacterium]
MEKTIILKEVSKIQAFNATCSHCDYDVDLKQGKYLVDAKSIMGIFSLNVEQPMTLILGTEDAAELEKFSKYFAE